MRVRGTDEVKHIGKIAPGAASSALQWGAGRDKPFSDMWTKLANPGFFMRWSSRLLPWFVGATVLAFVVGLYMTFFVAPAGGILLMLGWAIAAFSAIKRP